LESDSPKAKQKRHKYEQKYKVDYCEEFKFVTTSSAGNTYAFCTVCRTDVTSGNGGCNGIWKHSQMEKSTRAVSAAKSQPSVGAFIGSD
jgi:hypothetical protein